MNIRITRGDFVIPVMKYPQYHSEVAGTMVYHVVTDPGVDIAMTIMAILMIYAGIPKHENGLERK